MDKAYAVFTMLDKSGDGQLDRLEIQEGLKQGSHPIKPPARLNTQPSHPIKLPARPTLSPHTQSNRQLDSHPSIRLYQTASWTRG